MGGDLRVQVPGSGHCPGASGLPCAIIQFSGAPTWVGTPPAGFVTLREKVLQKTVLSPVTDSVLCFTKGDQFGVMWQSRRVLDCHDLAKDLACVATCWPRKNDGRNVQR